MAALLVLRGDYRSSFAPFLPNLVVACHHDACCLSADCCCVQDMLSPRELELVEEINCACSPLLRIDPVPDPPSAGPATPLQVRPPARTLC